MLILVTGVPGAGKTLFSIELIEKFQKEGREVYADIEGLTLPGVMPSPDDWRDAPDGSVVVYDEAQRKYPADNAGGRSSRDDIAEMEVHRHRGFDLVLITQHPNLIHSHVRRLVGRHHHLFRLFGSAGVKVFTQDRVMRVDSMAELERADQQMWQHPKRLFGVYKSATVHTHKFRIPRRVAVSLGVIAVAAIGSWYAFSSSSLFNPLRGEAIVADASAAESGRVAVPGTATASGGAVKDEPTLLSGCMATASVCRCYDLAYNPVPMSDAQCRNQLLEPLWRPVREGGRNASGRESRSEAASSPIPGGRPLGVGDG